MAVFTGGMKNLFGLVPGKIKVLWHNRMPDLDDFSEMIVDLNELLKPSFCISDAIYAQEGNGPRSGNPFYCGSLIMSPSLFLADLLAAVMIGHRKIDNIPIISHYGKRNNLSFNYNDYQVHGDKLKIYNNFNKGKSKKDFSFLPQNLKKFLKKHVSPFPFIITEKCRKCGICFETCPTAPKSITWKKNDFPVYKYSDCIRCFCCQEMCPYEAIEIKYPLLAKVLK